MIPLPNFTTEKKKQVMGKAEEAKHEQTNTGATANKADLPPYQPHHPSFSFSDPSPAAAADAPPPPGYRNPAFNLNYAPTTSAGATVPPTVLPTSQIPAYLLKGNGIITAEEVAELERNKEEQAREKALAETKRAKETTSGKWKRRMKEAFTSKQEIEVVYLTPEQAALRNMRLSRERGEIRAIGGFT